MEIKHANQILEGIYRISFQEFYSQKKKEKRNRYSIFIGRFLIEILSLIGRAFRFSSTVVSFRNKILFFEKKTC
jgi:hypothetical protein